MARFYIPPEQWNLGQLALAADEAHHALNVLRMSQGDRAVVFNGKGSEAEVEFALTSKHAIQLRTLSHRISPPLPCEITLAQAVPKGKNMDLVIQKATELGAAAIVPLLTERTVVQLDGGDLGKKQEKWQAVAIEACKQCGQNWLPQVSRPVTLKGFLGSPLHYDLLLIASLEPNSRHLKTILSDFEQTHGHRPRSVMVLIGPEGDFSFAELALARNAGCRPITLGPIVLRTETAALYCLGVLSYELLVPQ